jgi:putative endonuclease
MPGRHSVKSAIPRRELERRGCAIVALSYRLRGGGVNIIARDGPTMVFVEVKARVGRRFGGAVDAVTGLKRHRMAQLAFDYLTRHRLTGSSCRFDVVSIQLENGRPIIEVFQNAFDADELFSMPDFQTSDFRLSLRE